jgi:hypothetical protein
LPIRSLIGTPDSPSFRISAIWASLNLDFLILLSPHTGQSTISLYPGRGSLRVHLWARCGVYRLLQRVRARRCTTGRTDPNPTTRGTLCCKRCRTVNGVPTGECVDLGCGPQCAGAEKRSFMATRWRASYLCAHKI